MTSPRDAPVVGAVVLVARGARHRPLHLPSASQMQSMNGGFDEGVLGRDRRAAKEGRKRRQAMRSGGPVSQSLPPGRPAGGVGRIPRGARRAFAARGMVWCPAPAGPGRWGVGWGGFACGPWARGAFTGPGPGLRAARKSRKGHGRGGSRGEAPLDRPRSKSLARGGSGERRVADAGGLGAKREGGTTMQRRGA